MSPTAVRLREALRDAHDRLYTLVTGLGEGDLEKPSYCEGWTVAQVLSHLGSAAEIGRAAVAAALGEQEPLDQKGREAVWDRWNAKSPAEQAAESGASDDAFVGLLEGLEPERLESLSIPHGPGELPAADFLLRILGERSLHTWDVAVSFDPSVRLRPEHVDLLVDGLGGLAGRYTDTAGYDGPPRVAVHTVEPERHFLITAGEQFDLEPLVAPAGEPGEVKLPAEAFVRLFYGRLDSEHLPDNFEASGVSLEQLRRLFPGG